MPAKLHTAPHEPPPSRPTPQAVRGAPCGRNAARCLPRARRRLRRPGRALGHRAHQADVGRLRGSVPRAPAHAQRWALFQARVQYMVMVWRCALLRARRALALVRRLLAQVSGAARAGRGEPARARDARRVAPPPHTRVDQGAVPGHRRQRDLGLGRAAAAGGEAGRGDLGAAGVLVTIRSRRVVVSPFPFPGLSPSFTFINGHLRHFDRTQS